MPVNTTDRLNNASQVLRNQATQTQSKDGKMGKQDFMNLFLTQMSNQSPTDPMDSGAMMSQLAQMGSMEQLENLNKGVESLNQSQASLVGMQALNYLDRDVLLEADHVELARGQSQAVYYSLPKDAEHLQVTIENEEGTPIFSQALGYAPFGQHRFAWDGKDDRGVLQNDGKYKVSFTANFVGGGTEKLSAFNHARVSGVDFEQGQAFVKAQGRRVPLSQVRSVNNTSARLFDQAKPLPQLTELAPKGAYTKEPKIKL